MNYTKYFKNTYISDRTMNCNSIDIANASQVKIVKVVIYLELFNLIELLN